MWDWLRGWMTAARRCEMSDAELDKLSRETDEANTIYIGPNRLPITTLYTTFDARRSDFVYDDESV